MVDNGSVTKTLNPGDSYTIPKGFHNGSGKITVTSLADNTSATATAADILDGKTAWVNGEKITGTMPERAASSNAQSVAASSGIISVRILTGAYLATTTTGGAPEIKFNASEIGLTADKILAGQSVAGIDGTATSDATATAADIATGKTAYVNGELITGTMTPQSFDADNIKRFTSKSYTAPSDGYIYIYGIRTIAEGYYNETRTVIVTVKKNGTNLKDPVKNVLSGSTYQNSTSSWAFTEVVKGDKVSVDYSDTHGGSASFTSNGIFIPYSSS